MPGLSASLQGHDLGHLKIVAAQWGLDLQATSTSNAIEQLEARLPATVAADFAGLPKDLTVVIGELSSAGRLPWGQFERKFGELREMGPGRRDKEQPQNNPVSVTEMLWYRGLIGRAFFDTNEGPREFAYVPDELLAVIPRSPTLNQPYGRAARPEERAVELPANDSILDQTCTLLAGLRAGINDTHLMEAERWLISPRVAKWLLKSAGLLDPSELPIPGATRKFLEATRAEALVWLVQAWLESDEFDELRSLPGLVAEGNWENHPRATRQRLFEFVHSAPEGQWWSLRALIADVKTRGPDFQRPTGDYDSWYLRNEAGGDYLRGFEHWDEVDGALIAYFVRGPLHALGLVDLASPATNQSPVAFRWSSISSELLAGETPVSRKTETQKIRINSGGKVLIPTLAPRAVRYLVARFCDWLPKQKDGYVYQISARSLEAARKQGLKVKQLVTLLKANSSAPLPPNLLQALKRWESQGTQVHLGAALVLRVSSAATLKALRTSRAARFLGDPLGPTAILVKTGAGPQVMQALLELGYLGEFEETQL